MSSSYAALIIDTDPQGLESLVYGFQGSNWRITACPALEVASLLVKASGANLVVLASRTDHDRAIALARQLRGKDNPLPILMLAPQSLRSTLAEIGGVDLLPLPAFVRDVLTASQMLVAFSQTAAQNPGQEPCFQANLAMTSSSSLTRVMKGLGRSGQLRLQRKARYGDLFFHEGELTFAQIGPRQGMAAIQHLMVWDEGMLELCLRPIVRRGHIHFTAPTLLDEIERFRRDFAHAAGNLGPLGAIFTADEWAIRRRSDVIPTEVFPVLRLCDGQHALVDIIDESPFRVLDTMHVLARLLEVGALTKATPPAAEQQPGSLDGFWSTAKILPTPDSSAAAAVQPPPAAAGVPQEPAAASTTVPAAVTADPCLSPAPAQAAFVVSAAFAGALPAQAAKTDATASPAQSCPAGSAPAPSVAPPANDDDYARKRHSTSEMGGGRPAIVPGTWELSPADLAIAGVVTPPPVRPEDLATPPAKPGAVVVPQSPMPSSHSSLPSVSSDHVAGPASVQTSGTIELGKSERRPGAKPVRQTSSILVAIDPIAPPQTDDTVRVTVRLAPAEPGASGGDRITGEIQVLPSRRNKSPTPPRNTIQLDASLATGPAAPTDVASTQTPPTAERVTGELRIEHPSKQSRAERPSPQTSFHIDPALSQPTATPAEPPASSAAPSHGPEEAPTESDSRRANGGFSALESEFFEREADLYKVDKTESFADLEDVPSKRGSGRQR